jgi:hypothetical protein
MVIVNELYRSRIGGYHSIALLAPHRKRLDLQTFMLTNLVLQHGLLGITIMTWITFVHIPVYTEVQTYCSHSIVHPSVSVQESPKHHISPSLVCVMSLLMILCSNVVLNMYSSLYVPSPHHHCTVSAITLTYYFLNKLTLLLSGDVEKNPGPTSLSDMSDTSSNNSAKSSPNDHFTIPSPGDFSVLHLNIQSLIPKLDIIEIELTTFDVLIFSETWIDQSVSDHDISLPYYTPPFRSDRTRHGGGVAIYVKENIPVRRRADLEIVGLECVWLELNVGIHPVLIGGFYRPPSIQNWEVIEMSIDRAHGTGLKNIIIAGDFNENLLDQKRTHILPLLTSYSLTQVIEEPTHFTETSATLLDLFIVNDKNKVKVAGVGEPVYSDSIRYHCPIYVILSFKKNHKPTFRRTIWKYEDGNYDMFRQELASVNWDSLLSNQNIDSATSIITDIILAAASKAIPNKLVAIRPQDPPWMHSQIRKMIRKRKRLHKLAKKSNNPSHWENFRSLRNKVIREIRNAQNQFQKKLTEKLNTSHRDPKSWWKLVKQIMGSSKNLNTRSQPLDCNGNMLFDDKEKADAFNNYFAAQSNVDDSKTPLPPLNRSSEATLHDIEVNPDEVTDILATLNTTKASGPDLIHPRLLREGANQLGFPLAILINTSMKEGKFPKQWKLANVSPIYKKDDKSLVTNYRPISLLSCLGKVVEKCVYKKLNNYLLDNCLLTPLQSGFRPRDSTAYQLTDIYNTLTEALDAGKEVRIIFCDISKAFDRVWHKGLILKLKQIGIEGNVIKWINDYLTGRKQRVVLNSKYSEWKDTNSGVPQGSVLGPLLFLIFINDIVTDINATVKLFADDTTLYMTVDNPTRTAAILNDDLQKIHLWAEKWLVKFNPDKTETMTISKKQTPINHPKLYMNNTEIRTVPSHKHLGVFLSKDGSWHDHIKYISNKAWKRLGSLRSLKFRLDRTSLQKLYFSYVRPILEYADIIWDNCTEYEKYDLEKIQLEAARIVTGATKSASRESLYLETGWENLDTRRQKHKLIQFYKMQSGLSPNYLTSLISTSSSNYNTRYSTNFVPPAARTCLFQNSFIPSTIRLWNSLPPEAKIIPTLNSFKSYLNKNRSIVPQHYSIGRRESQVIYTRLRMGCSNLNSDLYNNYVSETNLCTCGQIENANHYLLYCPLYKLLRDATLFSIPFHLDIDTLLYGNAHYDNNTNNMITLAVHSFIQLSKRFSN